jgi:predicted GIY-YIG superfamily endonuclease
MTRRADQRFWKGRFIVYRLYDESGRLLYIGSTGNARRRQYEHSCESWWWPQVARIRVQMFGTREAAQAAERAAVSVEAPAFNVWWTGGNHEEMRSRMTKRDRVMHRAWQNRPHDAAPWWPPQRRLRAVSA